MKKYSKIIFVIFLIIFSAGLWLLNSNITRVPLLSDDNFYFVKGQVQEVIEDNTTNKEVNGGSQTVKVTATGKLKALKKSSKKVKVTAKFGNQKISFKVKTK